MGQQTPRPSASGAEIYWRRRVVALAVGLALFALIAWAVNGTLSGPATGASATAGASRSASPAASTAPSTPPGGPAGDPAREGRAGSQQPTSGGGDQPAACRPGDVVLSLRQPQASYGRGGRPSFRVDVVSTAARPCLFNTGRRFVALVIRSGQDPLWNSSACLRGAGSHVANLARGVPLTLSFSWDRATSSSGCQGQARPARPGTYTATAVSGHLTSNSLIFVLQGHGVAVP